MQQEVHLIQREINKLNAKRYDEALTALNTRRMGIVIDCFRRPREAYNEAMQIHEESHKTRVQEVSSHDRATVETHLDSLTEYTNCLLASVSRSSFALPNNQYSKHRRFLAI